jgi:hypothetical protein
VQVADVVASDTAFVPPLPAPPPTGAPGRAGVGVADLPGGFLWSLARDRAPAPAASAPPSQVLWTALWCSMPTRPSRVRLATWRELTRLRAVSLHRSMWAVPHGETGEPPLQPLLEAVALAEGDARVHVVTGAASEDLDFQRRLIDTCEHLWDAFFNDVDRLAARLEDGAADACAVAVFDALRQRYVELLVTDVVASGASERARRRLRRCGDALAGGPVGAAERGVRHELEVLAAVAGTDGLVRYTVTPRPLPSDDWERAFGAFESYLYRPEPTRVPCERGVFTFRSHPSGRDGSLTQLAERIDRFERSLA